MSSKVRSLCMIILLLFFAFTFAALCMITLLLFFALKYAALPDPVFSELKGVETERVEVEEYCERVGEEECLMRRTRSAHTYYIYTQKQKP